MKDFSGVWVWRPAICICCPFCVMWLFWFDLPVISLIFPFCGCTVYYKSSEVSFEINYCVGNVMNLLMILLYHSCEPEVLESVLSPGPFHSSPGPFHHTIMLYCHAFQVSAQCGCLIRYSINLIGNLLATTLLFAHASDDNCSCQF